MVLCSKPFIYFTLNEVSLSQYSTLRWISKNLKLYTFNICLKTYLFLLFYIIHFGLKDQVIHNCCVKVEKPIYPLFGLLVGLSVFLCYCNLCSCFLFLTISVLIAFVLVYLFNHGSSRLTILVDGSMYHFCSLETILFVSLYLFSNCSCFTIILSFIWHWCYHLVEGNFNNLICQLVTPTDLHSAAHTLKPGITLH